MRKSSQVLIYLDLGKALRDGLKFYVSSNGVVLSPGDEHGYIRPQYFLRVEKANRQTLPGWEGASDRNPEAGATSQERTELAEAGTLRLTR